MSAYRSEYDHRACEHESDDVSLAACDMDSLIAELQSAIEDNSYSDYQRCADGIERAWNRLCEPS